MSENVKLTRKPAKKSFQSAIIAATASSRFRKRQASEVSASSTLASEATTGSSSSLPETWSSRPAPSSTVTRHVESLTPSGGESAAYESTGQSRLESPQRQLDQASADAAGVDINIMGTVLEASEPLVQSSESMFPQSYTPTGPYNHTTPPPSRSATPTQTTSRGHWNQLRNVIVPGPANPIPPVDVSQAAATAPPQRPQTPKPSRFRLGFRQVVDQTRELAQDDNARFDAEIHQACVAARFGDIRQKSERDGTQGGHLPFMSTASLPLSVASSINQPGKSGAGQFNDAVGRSTPSLRLLHQTLVRYTSLSGFGGPMNSLPSETEILSVLLIPFTVDLGQRENEERWLAVESFELVVKTWHAPSSQRDIDRVLWCCKAALIPTSPVRSRVLSTLSNIIFSSKPLEGGNPLALQNLLQGLLLILHSFRKDPQTSRVDIDVAHELINHLTGGACGKLDQQQVEMEYEALWGLQDNEEAVKRQIVAEGVVRCMQNGSKSLRRWILHESVERYWPSPLDSPSPLCRKIMARRMSAFLSASLTLLRVDITNGPHHFSHLDSIAIIRLLQRALPELAQLPLPKHINDCRALVTELAMRLLSVESHVERQQIVELVCGWCRDDGWKQCLETGLRLFIERAEWSRLSKTLQDTLNVIPEHERKMIVSFIFSFLHSRLVVDPAPHPLPGLTLLLRSLAHLYPQQFYKPLFSLAVASKDLTLVGQFGIVTALARHLPEFWFSDPEMISVALMSSVGSITGDGSSEESGRVNWGKTRIGQSLIMVELIRCIRQLSKEKKDKSLPPDAAQNQAYRFVTGLEARLTILLDAKEKGTLVPFSQRILLSNLLLEIRLFTRSLKPAPWLRKIVTWATQSYLGAKIIQEGTQSLLHDNSSVPKVTEDAFDEVLSTISKIQSIHIACWQTAPPNTRQRSTMIYSPTLDPRTSVLGSPDRPESYSEAIKEREELMASLYTSVASATLHLLVTVCALITEREHRVIGSLLWSHLLDEKDPRIIAPACFLLTHCLEKTPTEITDLIVNERRSSDSIIRQTTILRLMTLFAWRSQLLSQTYLYDRARRRPFRMARQPIAFVAIDAGSGHYVHEQTEEDRKSLPGGSLPSELRKKLAEVGWEQDDQPTDTRLERIKAPVSLFPASQLERFTSSSENPALSTARSTESVKQLLRRKSSSSGHHSGAKRRPVFVPALVSMFSSIITLATDPSPTVASAAREAILLMLRDDPVMLCRPVMDTLSADLMHVGGALSTLSAFLHIHHRLPPSASHHIFSHLGGFLKHVSRDSDNPMALRAFSYTVPVLSTLITQVSNLSIRDLRRAKFEIYVFPSGSLWFSPTAPLSTMFPQSMGPAMNPFDDLPPQLVGILMVRTAQNMLLLNMLKHKPQEVVAIRKSLTRLTLPGQNVWEDLDIASFLPHRPSTYVAPGVDYRRASLAFSRSHLLLLAQVFRSMSRNFNGREELARLFDGVNRILLAHGDDIGIVSHALIACMIAVTRFKRLISSSGGFTLFMPSVVKVYAEAEGHAGIRHAIQYASSRFYAIHQEAYVFQSLDLASNIVGQLELSGDQDWFAKNIYELFSGLKSPLTHDTPDAAGLRGVNKLEEREALIATTVSDETPRSGNQDSPRGEQLRKILIAGQYDNVVLNLDDFVRLLLTVIAHDPTVTRAQNFLALLRCMAPEFYNGTNSAREVLREGINALGSALFTKFPRQRMHESISGRSLQKSSIDVSTYGADNGPSSLYDPSAPCDQMVIRREYLKLIVAYTRMGGELRHGTVRRALDIVKGLLKESGRPHPEAEGTFLHELIETSLSRLSVTPKRAVTLLSDIAPVVKTFALSINCGKILDAITELMKRPELANDDPFVQLVVDQIAGPVLDACNDAASDNTLLSLSMRPAVVRLLGHAAALSNADIISHVERQSPFPGFLAGIVLPLCLTMKTSADLMTGKQWRHQDRLAKRNLVFVRLLVYAMEACNVSIESETGRSSPLPGINGRDSHRSKHSSLLASRTPLATLTLVIQIIKVIVLRATDDLSRGLTGIWARLAAFLKHLLDDGDARFALNTSSPAPTPWQSPTLGPRPHSLSSDTHAPFSPAGSVPRVVDYITWSLLEYLCCAPSPLTLQMRLWMQEKVHHLDAELQIREASTPLTARGSRRFSSSVFARPRRSSTSPDAIRASHGLSSASGEFNLSASNLTDSVASSRFSSRGSLQPSGSGLRIVHLGPTKDHHQMFQPMERSSSQDSHLKSLARSSHVGLPSLVKSTYTRIRLVQTHMGYDRLLPIEGQELSSSNVDLKALTRTPALAGILAEVKELMDEFPENFYENIGGDFVDVSYGAGPGFGSVQSSPVKDLHR